jgi:hypothetical protein
MYSMTMGKTHAAYVTYRRSTVDGRLKARQLTCIDPIDHRRQLHIELWMGFANCISIGLHSTTLKAHKIAGNNINSPSDQKFRQIIIHRRSLTTQDLEELKSKLEKMTKSICVHALTGASSTANVGC